MAGGKTSLIRRLTTDPWSANFRTQQVGYEMLPFDSLNCVSRNTGCEVTLKAVCFPHFSSQVFNIPVQRRMNSVRGTRRVNCSSPLTRDMSAARIRRSVRAISASAAQPQGSCVCCTPRMSLTLTLGGIHAGTISIWGGGPSYTCT